MAKPASFQNLLCEISGDNGREGQSVRLFRGWGASQKDPDDPRLFIVTPCCPPRPVDLGAGNLCFSCNAQDVAKTMGLSHARLCCVRPSRLSCWHTAVPEGSQQPGRAGGLPPSSQTERRALRLISHRAPTPANSRVTWKQTLPTPQGSPQPRPKHGARRSPTPQVHTSTCVSHGVFQPSRMPAGLSLERWVSAAGRPQAVRTQSHASGPVPAQLRLSQEPGN